SEEDSPAGNRGLRPRIRHRTEIKRPLQLHLRHVRSREAALILETRVGHVRTPSVPTRRCAEPEINIAGTGPSELRCSRFRVAARPDITDQREDLRSRESLRLLLHDPARQREINRFSSHGLERAERRHSAIRLVMARSATFLVNAGSILSKQNLS